MAVEVNQVGKQGGVFANDYCSAAHPTRDDVWCRRIKHAEGDHAAFVHGVKEPEKWPA
jgi:hypothetical protein